MANNSIQLQSNSILHVPVQNYEQNFTFIVNDEEFVTSRLVADLLSPKISKFHITDPTINVYKINTKSRGDFNNVIKLVNFENVEISPSEIQFVIEVIENFENTSKTIKINTSTIEKDQSLHSTLQLLKEHQKYPFFYNDEISKGIEKVSEELNTMNDEDKEIFESLEFDVMEKIISCPKLQLESEDELVEIIDNLYLKDRKYSELYSYVIFSNVSPNKMKEFVSIILFDDITNEAWKSLSTRLCEEIKPAKSEEEQKLNLNRYKKQNKKEKEKQTKPFKTILYENQDFDGLINFLRKNSNIKDELNITCSSIYTSVRDP